MKLESIHSPYRNSGFTLVEVMVAITLSIVLLAGVGQIYSSSKQIYRLQEAQSRVQENGRFAIEFLNRDIRQAGFAGCGNLNNPDFQGQVNVIANTTPPTTFNPASVIQGIETSADWSGGAPTDYVNNTDAVIITLASSNSVRLAGNLNPVNANIQIASNALGFKQNDLVFITDCKNADLFSITNMPGTGPGVATLAHAMGNNTSNNLSTPYQQNAEVIQFQTIAYYIRLGPANNAGVRLRSLYKRVGNTSDELIEGVQDMQVLYGEDTDNDQSANRYAAKAAVNMANVVSVRISLLLRSIENNVLGTNQTVAYNSANVAAPNGQLYRVFTTTIALRNRTP